MGAADEQISQREGAGENSYRSSAVKVLAGLAADPGALCGVRANGATMKCAILVVILLAVSSSALSAQQGIRAVEVARVGCLDCRGPQLLTRVHALALAHGRLYVVDASAPYVRMFDLSGRHVLSFGRSGDGPGEFRFPFRLNVRPDSLIEVFDLQQNRVTLLTPTGNQLSTRQIGLGMLPSLSTHARNPEVFGVVSTPRDSAQRVFRLTRESPRPVPISVADVDLAIRGGSVVPPAIAAKPGSGFAIGLGREDYRILILRGDGTRESEIRRNIPRIRKSQAELAAEARTREAVMREMSRRVPASSLPRVVSDEYRRHFNAMSYDDVGRLWVRTLRRLDATVFDVFDSAARYVGELVVPGNINDFAVGDTHMAAAVQDESGVPNVVIYRLN